jgi:hypothetical protein
LTEDTNGPHDPPRDPSPPPSASILATVNDRIDNYRLALATAKSVGDNSKTRRLERGLKVWGDLALNFRLIRFLSDPTKSG